MPAWDLRAPKVGEQATDLDLLDESGRPVHLSALARRSPILVLVFGGLDDAAGIRLLRDYRDATLPVVRAGAFICAIGPAEPAALRYLRSQCGFAFPMLSDADGTALSVECNGQRSSLRPDVWTTTYWCLPPETFRNQSVPLLDVDTGRPITAFLQFIGKQRISVLGRLEECSRYRLRGGGLQVELWFDSQERMVRQEAVEQGHKQLLELIRMQ